MSTFSPASLLFLIRRRRAGSGTTPEPPPPPTPDASIRPLTAACLAIRTLLVDSGLFTEPRCIVSLAKQPFPTPSPPCCAICPGGHSFDPRLNAGGGRYTAVTDSEFVVKVILRHASDYASQDLHFLTQPDRGGYPLIEAVVDVLTEEFLVDPDGNQLATSGLKPVRVGSPEPYGTDPQLGLVPITFAARVRMRPTLPYLD